MRICLLGNSHAASLIAAWRGAPDLTGVAQMQLVVQSGKGPRDIIVQNGDLSAGTPELKQVLAQFGTSGPVALRDFDAIVITGCGLSIFPLVSMFRHHTVWGWPSSDKVLARLMRDEDSPPARQMISQPCADAALGEIMSQTLAVDLAQRIRAQVGIPIFLIPQPRPAQKLLSHNRKGAGFNRLLRIGDAPKVSALFDTALAELANGLGDTTVLYQPPETIEQYLTTQNAYTDQAQRLANLERKQRQEDILHANGEYGALVLQQLRDRLNF